jgi:hypothetical protein
MYLFTGSQVDICSEAAYSERRSQSVANMKQKQQRKGGRRISRLFGSDNEEEINSVVSDIPGMYGRSASMVGSFIFYYLVHIQYILFCVWGVGGFYCFFLLS